MDQRLMNARVWLGRRAGSVARAVCPLRIMKDETGSEIVEFAVCIPMLIGIIFGIMYCSFALYADHFVANAAKEGVRYAAVRGSTWGGTSCLLNSGLDCTATVSDITNFVAGTLPPGLSPQQLTVVVTWPGTTPAGDACDAANGTNSRNCEVNVSVTYNFSFPLPFVNHGVIPMSSSAALTVMN